jgi:hypothetical protein
LKRQAKNSGATRDRTADHNRSVARSRGHLRGEIHPRKVQFARSRVEAGKDCDNCDNRPRIRPDGLTPDAVAEVLGLSRQSVFRLARGPLVAYRHGPRDIRILPDDLAAFQAGR